MARFRDIKTLQKFAAVHASIHNHFNHQRVADRGGQRKRVGSAGLGTEHAQHVPPPIDVLDAQSIVDSGNASAYGTLVKRLAEANNRVLGGDIVTALLAIEGASYDFGGLVLADAHLGSIDLSLAKTVGLRIEDSFIDELAVEGGAPQALALERCVIGVLLGFGNSEVLPDWMQEVAVERFDSISNVAKIREAKLTKTQEMFVTIVHKTFFQPGSGRMEKALLRGLGASADRKSARRIIGMLLEEGVLKQFPGKQGRVLVPVRRHARRMSRVMTQLRYSDDPLWQRLGG